MKIDQIQTNHFRDPDLGISRQELNQIQVPGQVNEAEKPKETTGFFEMLQNAVENVNADQVQADSAVKDLISGRNKNIHETMLALQKADISLKTAMQVRNKILEAYKEIMRMQV